MHYLILLQCFPTGLLQLLQNYNSQHTRIAKELWLSGLAGSFATAGDTMFEKQGSKRNNSNSNNFYFLLSPFILLQKKGTFLTYSSYFHRPIPLLQRLIPQLYKPPKYQFILTTAWKKMLPETIPESGNNNNPVVRTCSGVLTSHQPINYIFSCHNVTQEGIEPEKVVEVSPVTAIKTSAIEEGSGSDQDEEPPEEDDGTLDLSRCLGCIFGMLNKPSW
ncbi:uncharacterized protein LOC130272485 isoform X1 [Hyla sarda]|uniref:uncharacterized protein LOC130272485 isoform X1 n=1 Tax=Hyla sarda TaxID=327740 RepID=UPI0024C2AF4D|nr:uncharacterized protein LOC130272485 isoform X1 [Hyla sarda]